VTLINKLIYHAVRACQGQRTWCKARKSVEKNKTADLLISSRHAIPDMHGGMSATIRDNSEQLMFSRLWRNYRSAGISETFVSNGSLKSRC